MLSKIKQSKFMKGLTFLCLIFATATMNLSKHAFSSLYYFLYPCFCWHNWGLLSGNTGNQEDLTSAVLKERHSRSEFWSFKVTTWFTINMSTAINHWVLIPIIRNIALMMLCKDSQITPSMSCAWMVHEILMS